MATKAPTDDDGINEDCPDCGRETAHDVSIQILTESRKEENAEFSREPYRVSVCERCGHEETVRMNNVR